MDPSPPPSLAVLGTLEVRGPRGPVALAQGRQRLLVAALAVDANHPVSTDLLADRLGVSGRGAATVQVAMSRLRRLLADSGVQLRIDTAADGYLLRVDATDLDVVVFETTLLAATAMASDGRDLEAERRFTAALRLWRGPAFAGCGFDAAVTEAARLQEVRLAALEARADVRTRLGRAAEVVAELGPVAEQHPLRESSVRVLMRALYDVGRPADALRAYERTRHILAEQLGTDPGPELRDLHLAVLRHDPQLVRRPPPSAPGVTVVGGYARGPRPRAGALVGRRWLVDSVLATVTAHRERAVSVLVTGEAGVGRTRFVEELVPGLPGHVLAWGRTSGVEHPPTLWPWQQLLARLVERVGGPVTAAALTGRGADVVALLPGGSGVGSEAEAPLVFDAVVGFLDAVARHTPLLLVLADVHAADRASRSLLEYVCAALHTPACVVVATARDPSGRPPEQDRELGVFHAPVTRHVRLEPLSVEEVGELVTDRTGAHLSPDDRAEVHRRTAGNPEFLEQLLAWSGGDLGLLARVSLPPAVKAAVERRLTPLDTVVVTVLEAAAVLTGERGTPVPVDRLAAAVPLGADTVGRAVDTASYAGLLGTPDGRPGTVWFRQPLVAETLAGRPGPMRRAAIVRSAAGPDPTLRVAPPPADLEDDSRTG